MKIYQYVEAGDAAAWIATEFNLDGAYVYRQLLAHDCIEGRLGYRWEIMNEFTNEPEEWMANFLAEFNLNEIQLKY